jgi:hypothetical protein
MKKSLVYYLPRVAWKATSLPKGLCLICLTLLLVQTGVAQVSPGRAITLNAVNQYCTMVQSTAVTGDFTVEAWVRPDATTDRPMSIFSSRYNNDYSFDMKIDYVANGNSTIHADIGNGTAWLNTASSVAYKFVSRQWYHIAYTVSGSANQYIIYVNGRQVGSGTITSGASAPVLFNSTHTNANIGKNESTQSEYFLGLMDEVRIYSRVLNATEMLGEATGASTSSTGRVKYFSFENASGNTFTNLWNSSDQMVYQGSAISTQTSYALVLPEAIAPTSVAATSFIANWSAPVSGTVTNYVVDVATDQDFANKVVNGQSVNVGTTSLAVTSLSAGTQYYYRVRANNTAVTTDSYGAYSNTVLVSPSVSGNKVVCIGGTTQLTAVGATGASYAWYTAATGGTLLASSAEYTTPAITADIHFYVEQTVNGNTSPRTDVLVQMLGLPATPAVTSPAGTSFCPGSSITLSTTNDPSYTYLWSPGGATTASSIITTAGNYNVTVTNNNGCSATSANTAVSFLATPATPVVGVSGTTTLCADGSLTLAAPAGFTYLWSPGNQTTQSINVTTSGSYTVTVINTIGCGTTSAAKVVTVNALPSIPVITGTTSFCSGGSTILSAPAGYSYLWAPGGKTTQSVTLNQAGTYTVTVANANGCKATSATAVVTVNALPTPAIVAASAMCSGKSVTLLARRSGTVCATADEGGMLDIQAPPGAKFTALIFASYGTPTGTCGNFVRGSCHAANSESFVKSQLLGNSQASISASVANFNDPCSGVPKRLYVEAIYSYDAIPTDTYLWSTTATTSSITQSPTVATTYTVAVTDVNGCVGNASRNVSISQPSSSTTNIVSCAGNLPYIWNGLTFNAAGTKTATIVNAAGCDSLATLNLTLDTPPTLGTYTNNSVVTAQNMKFTPGATPPQAVSLVAYTNSNFRGVLTADPATGVVTVTDAKPAGIYTVTVMATGSYGCTATTSFTLRVTNPICSPGLFVDKPPVMTRDDSYPNAVAIGDFNGDGKQDMVISFQYISIVYIRLGNGAGGFTGSTSVAVGNEPSAVAIGDFNGDGNQDFATANRASNNVSICLATVPAALPQHHM